MNANITITYRDKDNNIIENPTEGQIAQSPETQQLYIYRDGNWEIIQASTGGLNMSMYDLNKQLIAQLPKLNEEDLDIATNTIKSFIQSAENTFYMLLCRDLNYYTLFHIVDYITEPAAADEVLACANCLGDIKSVDVTEHNAIEIWVHPRDGEQNPVVMYLFGYDGGVIECIL